MRRQESTLCAASSWQFYEHLLQRVHVHAQLDARLRVETKIDGMKINDVTHHNSLGKNSAVPARDHALAGRELRVAREITEFNDGAVQRRGGRRFDNPVLARFFNQHRNTTVGVAHQHHLRVSESHLRDSSDEAIDIQDRRVGNDSITRPAIDPNGAPPVGRVARDDLRWLQIPWHELWQLKQTAETRVFLRESFELRGAQPKLLVLALQVIDLPHELLSRKNGVAGLFNGSLGRAGSSKKGNVKGADGKLELRGGATGQLQDCHRHQHHDSESYIMRPSQHLHPDCNR